MEWGKKQKKIRYTHVQRKNSGPKEERKRRQRRTKQRETHTHAHTWGMLWRLVRVTAVFRLSRLLYPYLGDTEQSISFVCSTFKYEIHTQERGIWGDKMGQWEWRRHVWEMWHGKVCKWNCGKGKKEHPEMVWLHRDDEDWRIYEEKCVWVRLKRGGTLGKIGLGNIRVKEALVEGKGLNRQIGSVWIGRGWDSSAVGTPLGGLLRQREGGARGYRQIDKLI